MGKKMMRRIVSSFFSLVALVVMVFFLSRLTGDPAALFLPIDATQEMLDQFRELHGLNDPLIQQFGRYVWDVLQLDFGDSIRKARPAIDVVIESFTWTLQLALITIALVTALAITIGSIAAFRPGGLFDRFVSLVSLIGASAPDFWIAIVSIEPRTTCRIKPNGRMKST
ncbi:ABC transporter permease, partial [Sinorhizobium sp. 7-81]|nr:ABC transporter permease [Sinorhizobium sp. 8-89]